MYEAECPYCGMLQEINHDDGYGFEENELHEQECDNKNCGMTFGYYTEVIFSHNTLRVPCKNGEPHNLVDYKIFPEEFGIGKKRCSWCKDIIIVDEKANIEAVNKYMESLKNKC